MIKKNTVQEHAHHIANLKVAGEEDSNSIRSHQTFSENVLSHKKYARWSIEWAKIFSQKTNSALTKTLSR